MEAACRRHPMQRGNRKWKVTDLEDSFQLERSMISRVSFEAWGLREVFWQRVRL